MSEEEEGILSGPRLQAINLLIASTAFLIWYLYWYTGYLPFPHIAIPSEFWNLVIVFGPWVFLDLLFSLGGWIWGRGKIKEDKERQERLLRQVAGINSRLDEMNTNLTRLIEEISEDRKERKQG